MARAQLVPAWSWQLSSAGQAGWSGERRKKEKVIDIERKKTTLQVHEFLLSHTQPALNTVGWAKRKPPRLPQSRPCSLAEHPLEKPSGFPMNIIISPGRGTRFMFHHTCPGEPHVVPAPQLRLLPGGAAQGLSEPLRDPKCTAAHP